MSFSQNVRFTGVAPEDPDEAHPPGHALARFIEAELRAAGWDVLAVWDWRDCGWSIVCDRGMSALEVVVAAMGPSEWMLQIGPVSVPAFVQKVRGWRPTVERADVHDVATVVHAFLQGHYCDQRWCWDGFPDDDRSSPHPTAWEGPD